MALPLIPIITLVGTVLDKLIPDKDAANKAKAELETLLATQELQVQLAQIQTNMAEAQSPHLWTSGWRPFIGWACGFSFVYAFLIQPLLMFGVFTWGDAELVKQVASLPKLDLATMMPVLLGMLGLGVFRTVEKVKGAEGNR